MKVNLAQREEQFFYLYLAGSAQRESVYEKLPWIGTEPKNWLSLAVIDLVSKSQLSWIVKKTEEPKIVCCVLNINICAKS